jgi:transposase
LTSIPGVGPIVALSFIATIDDAHRFRRAVDVAAYLGLTPRRHQSGETDWTGRISKRGDSTMRKLLYEAANILIQRLTVLAFESVVSPGRRPNDLAVECRCANTATSQRTKGGIRSPTPS